MKYVADGTVGHIGKDTWSRLSPKQRILIKKDRKNAAKLVATFMKEKLSKKSR